VHLTVADLARSLAFYQERIGLRLHDQDGDMAVLGAGSNDILRITEVVGARPMPGHSGLYHFALLLPSRADLGATLGRLLGLNTLLTGAADHLVSEALYLTDPDGNGIELYRDRPRSDWRHVNGRIQMDTLPLDIDGLLHAAGPKIGAKHLPPETTVGHVHLHVADLASAIAFYRDVIGFELQTLYGSAAAFLSAGGYHHHLGVNTWAGVGAPPPPAGAAGLRYWQIRLPDEAALQDLRGRLTEAGVDVAAYEDGFLVSDPAGNGVLLSHH
jgi:catechol 2,3-dioxygenase